MKIKPLLVLAAVLLSLVVCGAGRRLFSDTTISLANIYGKDIPLRMHDNGDGSFALQTFSGGQLVNPGNTPNTVPWLVTNQANATASLIASAAQTTTQNSADQSNVAARSVIVFLNVSAASGTGGLTLRIQGKDSISGNYFFLTAAPTAQTATGQYMYVLGPGVTTTGGSVIQASAVPLPQTWRVSVVAGDSSSYTYSVSAQVIN